MTNVLIKIIEWYFNDFERNMMIIHFVLGFFFLLKLLLTKYGKKLPTPNELVFGIMALSYGTLMLYYYFYMQ